MTGEAKPFLVRLPPELRDAVEQAAKAEDRSMAAFVRQTLRAAVKKRKP